MLKYPPSAVGLLDLPVPASTCKFHISGAHRSSSPVKRCKCAFSNNEYHAQLVFCWWFTSVSSGNTFLSAKKVADALLTSVDPVRVATVPNDRVEGTSFSAVTFPDAGASTFAQMGNMAVTTLGIGIWIADVRSLGARMPNFIPILQIASAMSQVVQSDPFTVAFKSDQP